MTTIEQVRAARQTTPALSTELSRSFHQVLQGVDDKVTIVDIIETLRLPNSQFRGRPSQELPALAAFASTLDGVVRGHIERVLSQVAYEAPDENAPLFAPTAKHTLGEIRAIEKAALRLPFGAQAEIYYLFLLGALGKD